MKRKPKRVNVSSGAKWESIVGYSRAVRVGDRVFVTGTTATLSDGGHAGDGDANAQARQIFRNIETALARAGASLADVVRTRMFVTDIRRDWQAVGRAHAEVMGAVRPATTMVEVSRLIEDWMLVEIEADAIVGATPRPASSAAPVREAKPADAAAIAGLLRGCGLPVPDDSGPTVSFLVAAAPDGSLAGCIGCERFGHVAMLRSLAVDPTRRRTGVGRRLVEALRGRLTANGVTSIYLLTVDGMAFFGRCGFAPTDRAGAPPRLLASPLWREGHCATATLMRQAIVAR